MKKSFISVLQSLSSVDDVVSLSSVNFKVVSLGTYVSFDDVVSHGFDRPSNYTLDQISNMSNDIRKNTAARSSGINYLRVRSDSNWRDAKTWDELVACAYHIVDHGSVTREGTFRLLDDRHTLVSREELIRTNEVDVFPGAPGREFTRDNYLPVLREFMRAHVEYWGWFYPVSPTDDLSAVLSDVEASVSGPTTQHVSTSLAGSSWLRSRMKSFWHVDKGPVAATQDDKKFNAVLRYRLGLNESKLYHYDLSDGTAIDCRETFDINIRSIRTGLIVQRNSVSWFKPSTAADVYKRFLTGIDSPVVWDPSCGFGARLLGFVSLFPNGRYIGCEPASATYRDLVSLAFDLSALRPGLTVDVRQCGSENVCLRPNSVDLVFTSPPYFDREKYFDEPGQCWRDHPTLDDWTRSYLAPTMKAAHSALKQGCHMIVNVDKGLRDLVCDVAEALDFTHTDTLSLRTGRDHFNRKAGYVDSANSEPVLVFRK